MSRVLHMRGDVAGMFLFFVVFFLGAWQLLIALYRLNGLSLTGYPDRKCVSLVLGAVLVSGSCAWYFSAPGHFASPDVEGMETLLILLAGLVSATAVQAFLACAFDLARRFRARRSEVASWGEEVMVSVEGESVPGRYLAPERGNTAPPVLLLHDYGGSVSDLGGFASALAARGHACLAVDLDGHGGNPRGISTAAMGDLLEASSAELRRRAGGNTFHAAGVGMGGALAIELYRLGKTVRIFAADPPPRDAVGAPVVNSLRELGPVEVIRAFLRPPARRAGGGRASYSRVVEELPQPGALTPGEVFVAGTASSWFNSPESLEAYVRDLGLGGIVMVNTTHQGISGDEELLEACAEALS